MRDNDRVRSDAYKLPLREACVVVCGEVFSTWKVDREAAVAPLSERATQQLPAPRRLRRTKRDCALGVRVRRSEEALFSLGAPRCSRATSLYPGTLVIAGRGYEKSHAYRLPLISRSLAAE